MSRVVCSIGSPLMGGNSRWDLLGDPGISNVMPEAFGEAPEVVRGFLRREAEKAWRNWNPLIWGVIRYRGCFGAPAKQEPMNRSGAAAPFVAQKLSRCTAETAWLSPTCAGRLTPHFMRE